ncbi:hypothetical protein ACMFMG_004602 [Clarireedia jacksonii]
MPTSSSQSQSHGRTKPADTNRTTNYGGLQLSDAEKEIINTIKAVVNTRGTEGNATETPYIIVTTDIGRDFDDLCAHIMQSELEFLGASKSKLFVANLTDARMRTHYDQCVLKTLGMNKVPVAVGTNGYLEAHNMKKSMHRVNNFEYNRTIMSILDKKKANYPNGFEMMEEICKRARHERRKVTWLVISSVADICHFSSTNSELFKEVTEKVVFQGGYTIQEVDSRLTLKPDIVTNNDYDMQSAQVFFEYLFANGIKTVTYTRTAAVAVPIPAGFFVKLAETKHVLGETLQKVSERQWAIYYEMACWPKEDRHRAEHDQEWFLKYMTNWYEKHKKGELPRDTKHVMKYCKPVLYDALAVLGTAGDDILKALGVLTPMKEDPRHSKLHRVVGLTPLKNNSKKGLSQREINAMEADKEKHPDHYTADIGINPERMSQVIQTLIKLSIYRTLRIAEEAVKSRVRSSSKSSESSASSDDSFKTVRTSTHRNSTVERRSNSNSGSNGSNGSSGDRGDRGSKKEGRTRGGRKSHTWPSKTSGSSSVIFG